MAGYSPLRIAGFQTGLVQDREEIILPNDAYPILQNAYVWRERIKRKKGYQLLGRLQRNFSAVNYLVFGNAPYSQIFLTVSGYVAGANNANPGQITTTYPHNLMTGDGVIFTGVGGATGYNGTEFFITVTGPTTFTVGANAAGFGAFTKGGFWLSNRSLTATTETDATIVPGSFILTSGGVTFTDNGLGVLIGSSGGNTGNINYVTGTFSITASTVAGGTSAVINYSYYPGLPCMGIRTRENQSSINDETIFWDTVYAYNYNSVASAFEEFLPGTTWTGQNYEFFWTTNYWVDNSNFKIFWSTNYSSSGDPIRYTNGIAGTSWVPFAPVIDASGNQMWQCLAMIPFRGRMLAVGPREGISSPGVQYSNRIRWAAIGNPFTVTDTVNVPPIVTVTPGSKQSKAWRDDIRGQGGFLDIPTSEDIVAIGFVRDNLVIYCERSTWQLRYTGRSIAPFQIEKVNSELGTESTFGAIQFDTSLVGIGDKGIVECDSYKSERIDIKIPDLVFRLQNNNNGTARIQGIRDFETRIAYWTYVDESENGIFPNRRLVYNYENDSWAIFTDSLTALGTFQNPNSRTWINTHIPWIQCNFNWLNQPAYNPLIVGGNQQGFIEQLDEQTTNDPSLYILGITGNTTTSTTVSSPNHNLQTGAVITISGIPTGTPFVNLNGGIFGINVIDANTFNLALYNPATGQFSTPQLDAPATYIGGGIMAVRDNFNITSKKFNFYDEGQNIQLGYIDLLMPAIPNGAFSLNIFVDYNDASATNEPSQNSDTFFNQVIETSQSSLNTVGGSKFMQRVFCPTRANFITLQYTFNNAQMAGLEQQYDIQIDGQILWIRRAGRLTQI